MSCLTILGDSVLKGVTLGEKGYFINRAPEEKFRRDTGIGIENLSRFGCTTDKSLKSVIRSLKNHEGDRTVLVEYGGNDCDFDWKAISDDPDGYYPARVPLEKFIENYEQIIASVTASGAKPVAVSLMPVNAERYFRWFCKNGVIPENVMRWLGEVNVIYRYQEMYSDAVEKVARKTGTPIIDLRASFLQIHRLGDYICEDGIHPTEKGQELIWATLKTGLSPLIS